MPAPAADHAGTDAGGAPFLVPMRGRSPTEPHRAATPLELFFDLVFVVAVAQASAGLHHALVSHHLGEGLIRYAMAFFAIWWAWMNFTWFASAYDSDDLPYRLTVFLQMTGALILTAGIRAMFSAEDLTMAVVGYVVMRVAMVIQWLRAAHADPGHRTTARRYAVGIGVVQALWVALLWAPAAWLRAGFVAFAAVELLVPVWAERAGVTPWHRHHIAERYGLMTIIVLGESVLAASGAVYQALTGGPAFADLAPVIAGGLLIVYALWWLYFDRPAHPLLTSLRRAFVWGYGHYLVFASAAAVGAGLAVAIDQAAGGAQLSATAAGAAVAVPVALYLGVLWALVGRAGHPVRPWMAPIAVGLILLTPVTGQAVAWTGVVLVGLIAVKLASRHRAARARQAP